MECSTLASEVVSNEFCKLGDFDNNAVLLEGEMVSFTGILLWFAETDLEHGATAELLNSFAELITDFEDTTLVTDTTQSLGVLTGSLGEFGDGIRGTCL